MTKIRRQKRTIGDIVQIELMDSHHCYAHVLEEGLFAFYDARTQHRPSVNTIIQSPVLFIIPVMNHAVTSGRWVIVGNSAPKGALASPPARFIQDPIRPDKFSLYRRGKIWPATREECLGLEREAGWEPQHVEDRLRDHYLNRPNKWVESLRIR